MAAGLPQLDDLPRRTATEVKNRWRDLVREVRASGSVAVTNHDQVEMVVVEAGTYRELAALAEGAKARQQATLAELAAEFDRDLADVQAAGARKRVKAALAARGRVTPRPKAGAAF